MLKVDNVFTYGFRPAVFGMRNPLESWEMVDSGTDPESGKYVLGENDFGLAKRLVFAGPDHSKFMRMITVWCDILAPLYFWKEFDTYKVGTVANSCSTMHKIHSKEFVKSDFSHEHLFCWEGIDDEISDSDITFRENFDGTVDPEEDYICTAESVLDHVIVALNYYRDKYVETKRKEYWWQLIQLLPSSYNQKRTVCLNYAVLRNMYHARKKHKLDEWHTFCKFIESLPYSELITMDSARVVER